jgi:hypothetical protein
MKESNPLLELNKNTLFPSARALLEAGISCRQPLDTYTPSSQARDRWSVYWMEGGTELTLFPGGEGPQEMDDVDAVIDAIGGDQPAVLTRASLRRLGVN